MRWSSGLATVVWVKHLDFLLTQVHEKPIEVIRRNGWWKEGYRALWTAYQVDKRLTAGKNG